MYLDFRRPKSRWVSRFNPILQLALDAVSVVEYLLIDLGNQVARHGVSFDFATKGEHPHAFFVDRDRRIDLISGSYET
jgi:hypothetical protein